MASLKLLVVEDDIANLELMTEVFKTLEAEVRPISDSESAARVVAQEKFDGIFLDLEMPKLNGFELAQKIRESSWNKLTPIVVVTGREDRDTMQKAFAIGATFFLQKPVDRQKLNSLLRTVRGTGFRVPRLSSTRPRLWFGLRTTGKAPYSPVSAPSSKRKSGSLSCGPRGHSRLETS